MIKTQITDLLAGEKVPYRILPHSEPVFTVAAAASQRGVEAREMVKSILLREKSGTRYVMACVAGPDRLDPKAVRIHLAGWKRLTFASAEEITTVTGYVKGAVAPLCLAADIPVFFDVALAALSKVNISSGDPMAGLELAADDLTRLSKATLSPITEA